MPSTLLMEAILVNYIFRLNNGCNTINALTLFIQRLERHQRENQTSLMKVFGSEHYLIGSTAESTRIGLATEIDVFNKLEGLKKEYFLRKRWELGLTQSGKCFFGECRHFSLYVNLKC